MTKGKAIKRSPPGGWFVNIFGIPLYINAGLTLGPILTTLVNISFSIFVVKVSKLS
jgi:hypothetical protein